MSISINFSTSSISAICLSAKFPLLFQGYHRPSSDHWGRHHDLSIPTSIIIIIVIPGNWRHVPLSAPVGESSSLLYTRHGTVRSQRSIINVALTWIHLDHHCCTVSAFSTGNIACPQSSIYRSLSP